MVVRQIGQSIGKSLRFAHSTAALSVIRVANTCSSSVRFMTQMLHSHTKHPRAKKEKTVWNCQLKHGVTDNALIHTEQGNSISYHLAVQSSGLIKAIKCFVISPKTRRI